MNIKKDTGKNSALPPTYLLAAIITMVGLHFLLPGMKLLRFPWNLSGVIPLVVGILFNLTADKAFKKNQTTVKPFEVSSALITDGVFKITRNPMYLGFVLILVGLGLFMGSLSPLPVIPVFAVVMDLTFIRKEEKMLGERFGEIWLKYSSKARKWI